MEGAAGVVAGCQFKGVVSDDGHRWVGDEAGDVFQDEAVTEGFLADGGDGAGQGDGFQGGAAIEGSIAD